MGKPTDVPPITVQGSSRLGPSLVLRLIYTNRTNMMLWSMKPLCENTRRPQRIWGHRALVANITVSRTFAGN
ncbi:hypothetical protein JHK86_035450 [Glycine max]|nr:hypothetical protein JHK86_035450 [Glycine max]